MRRNASIALAWAFSASLATFVCATHPAQEPPIPVALNGQNEVGPDGQVGAGDLDATATATLSTDGHGALIFSITYQNVSGAEVSGLHIHGPGATPLTNSPIFIDILANLITDPPPPTLPDGAIQGTIFNPELFDEVMQGFDNPHEFYLNLHPPGPGGFAAGAVRGMLPEPGILGLAIMFSLVSLRRHRR